MALDGDLYGAGKLSPHSFCMDCKKPILDISRTRKKTRCTICNEVRMKKVLKYHSDRNMKLRKKEGRKKKTSIWSILKSKSVLVFSMTLNTNNSDNLINSEDKELYLLEKYGSYNKCFRFGLEGIADQLRMI